MRVKFPESYLNNIISACIEAGFLPAQE